MKCVTLVSLFFRIYAAATTGMPGKLLQGYYLPVVESGCTRGNQIYLWVRIKTREETYICRKIREANGRKLSSGRRRSRRERVARPRLPVIKKSGIQEVIDAKAVNPMGKQYRPQRKMRINK